MAHPRTRWCQRSRRGDYDKHELRYLIDETPPGALTFGNVAQTFHVTKAPTVKFPDVDIELSRVLDAREAITMPGPIPPSGSGWAVTRFTEIWDKGKATTTGCCC